MGFVIGIIIACAGFYGLCVLADKNRKYVAKRNVETYKEALENLKNEK